MPSSERVAGVCEAAAIGVADGDLPGCVSELMSCPTCSAGPSLEGIGSIDSQLSPEDDEGTGCTDSHVLLWPHRQQNVAFSSTDAP